MEEDYAKAQIPGAVEAHQKIMTHMNDNLHPVRYNTIRRLAQITLPTLILWEKNDQTNALEMGEEIHSLIKGSKTVLYDAGHYLPTLVPDQFNQDVLEFL